MIGFEPPTYPYERLVPIREAAAAHEGGPVDLSIGTPADPPPDAVVAALGASGSERGYPPSIGTDAYRAAAAGWLQRVFGVDVGVDGLAACVGTKELVASLPHLLHLRNPGRDVVLYPEVSYPTYEMGARLAGCRPVPVPVDTGWRLDLDAVAPADRERALCLWVNTPGNPTGAVEDVAAAVAWGRRHEVPVCSDECYVAFTWDGPPRSVLQQGVEGVLAVHSLSKRSNAAGLRAGFYAGEPTLVDYLREVRKHAGLMVPGPVQVAAVAAWSDERHVEEQRRRYQERLERLREILLRWGGIDAPFPGGGFYLWAPAPDGDAWGLVRRLADEGGAVVSPGEFYGPGGAGHVRIAAVQPEERLELLAARLGVA